MVFHRRLTVETPYTESMTTKKNTPPKKQPKPAAKKKSRSGDHIVGIGGLRVILVPDDDCWFAQGLEIDYSAQGANKDDAKKQFEDGLIASVHEHLRVYGDIKRLLRPAPTVIWHEFLYDPAADQQLYTQVTAHQIPAIPFACIAYVEKNTGAVA